MHVGAVVRAADSGERKGRDSTEPWLELASHLTYDLTCIPAARSASLARLPVRSDGRRLTYVPEPCRRTTYPSSMRPRTASRIVTRRAPT